MSTRSRRVRLGLTLAALAAAFGFAAAGSAPNNSTDYDAGTWHDGVASHYSAPDGTWHDVVFKAPEGTWHDVSFTVPDGTYHDV